MQNITKNNFRSRNDTGTRITLVTLLGAHFLPLSKFDELLIISSLYEIWRFLKASLASEVSSSCLLITLSNTH